MLTRTGADERVLNTIVLSWLLLVLSASGLDERMHQSRPESTMVVRKTFSSNNATTLARLVDICK